VGCGRHFAVQIVDNNSFVRDLDNLGAVDTKRTAA
jgi:hypothetical protein